MRRQDRWLELADNLSIERVTVVACMAFLNMGRSVGFVSEELGVDRRIVETINSRGKPLIRQSTRARKTGDERCTYCGSEHDLSRDHVLPKSRGGSNDPSNIVIACHSCNSAKGARTPQEWLS